METALEFLKGKIKTDFNTRYLVNKLDALYQEVLIGIVQEYADKKWIDVKDKLPEKPKFVNVCKENGLVVGMFYESDGRFTYGNSDQTSQVTYWMELPCPPNVSAEPETRTTTG